MKSMTGYGVGRHQSATSQFEISLRSVNGRYFEPRFHIPREFIPFEGDLKKLLTTYFERGTIDVFVARKFKSDAAVQKVSVNKDLARQYRDALKVLARELKMKESSSVEFYSRLPDVLTIESSTEISGTEKKALFNAFEKACKACDQERRREGKGLKVDLEKLLDLLQKQTEVMAEVREEANQALAAKFEAKLKSRLSDVVIDSARLSQEVVIQLEKSDINEELSRLREHLKNYRHLLSQAVAQGKKLDFYTQELLREVNTIGSKSGVSKLTQAVVEAKTLIERVREQVQNVE